MKKHFKLILAALSALLLFLTNVPAVNAAENNKSDTNESTEIKEKNEQQYKTTLTFHIVETKYGYGNTFYYYTFISSKPFYVFLEHSGRSVFPRYFCGDLEDFTSFNEKTGLISDLNLEYCAFSNYGIDSSGNTYHNPAMANNALTRDDEVLTILTANCPIFDSRESLSNYLETGSTEGCTNLEQLKDDWAYSGTISATDSVVASIEDRTYSLCSDGRLAILNEEEYVYQLYTGTGSAIYEESGGSLTKLSVDGVLWYNLFPMTRYNHYVSTIPIFKSREKLLNYIETGSYDGCINGNDLVFTGDTGFFLQKVAFHPVADGTGTMYFTWSNEQDYGNAEVEIFGDYSITLGLSKMGIRADLTRCSYSEGTYVFTYGEMQQTIVDTGRLEQKFLDKLAQTMIQPHYFYLRLVAEDGRMSGWVRVSAIPEAGTISYGVDTGFIDTDGNFVPNNELQDSYTSVPDPWTGKHDYEDSDKEVNGTQSMLDALSKFVDIIGSLIKSMGSVPELVKKVFGFLPNIFFVLIGGSFTVVVILRILGR